jgi:hypothetical protein
MILGSHGVEYEDGCLLGHSAIYTSLHGTKTQKTAIFERHI